MLAAIVILKLSAQNSPGRHCNLQVEYSNPWVRCIRSHIFKACLGPRMWVWLWYNYVHSPRAFRQLLHVLLENQGLTVSGVWRDPTNSTLTDSVKENPQDQYHSIMLRDFRIGPPRLHPQSLAAAESGDSCSACYMWVHIPAVLFKYWPGLAKMFISLTDNILFSSPIISTGWGAYVTLAGDTLLIQRKLQP